MNNQLLARMKKIQQAQGFVLEEPPKKTPQNITTAKDKKSNQQFQANKNRLKAFFQQKQGGGTSQPVVLPPKEQIKGNAGQFSNAKKMLQMNLGKKSGEGSSGLPPPPPSLNLPNLPPPPPPPSLGNLPPPPPPPPSNFGSNTANLPPPPRFSQISQLLPPPPPPPSSLTPQQTSTQQAKPIQPKTQQNSNFILPPPPQPPSFQKEQPKEIKINNFQLPPPPPPPPSQTFIQPTTKTPVVQQNPQRYARQQTFDNTKNNIQSKNQMNQGFNPILPPPPPPPSQTTQYQQIPTQQPSQNYKSPPNTNSQNNYSTSPQNNTPYSNIQNNLSPKINHQNIKQSPARKNIFTKPENISGQFFNNDIAGFLKRQFIRQTDIIGAINLRFQKGVVKCYFPSIQNDVRKVQPNQTLYADVDSLNLASCYRQRNMNNIKAHKQSRQQFVTTLKSYNWQADPDKLKQIQQLCATVPQNIKYHQPNLTKIKQKIIECEKLIKKYESFKNYTGCAQVQKLKEQIQKMTTLYMKNPQGNQQILQEIDRKLQFVQEMKK